MHPLVDRKFTDYLADWFPGTNIEEIGTTPDGNAIWVVSFRPTQREWAGMLMERLLVCIKVWPVVERKLSTDQAEPQGWGGVLDQNAPTSPPQPMPLGMAVIVETADGFKVDGVMVIGKTDPSLLIEPNLPPGVASLGPWELGGPDDVEASPTFAQALMGRTAVKLTGTRLKEPKLYIITAVPPNPPLTHILGCPASVVAGPFEYGPRKHKVVVVAIDTAPPQAAAP